MLVYSMVLRIIQGAACVADSVPPFVFLCSEVLTCFPGIYEYVKKKYVT